ncbi:hypothetical protein [Paenibacillus kobensis]|uniref:hypothetical protein n=1 Tax=Paenibacillus kobensis TaxID=59841 RepID=UPI000FDC150F|nr:hypothetical protein [Paenibacillus kobensis]
MKKYIIGAFILVVLVISIGYRYVSNMDQEEQITSSEQSLSWNGKVDKESENSAMDKVSQDPISENSLSATDSVPEINGSDEVKERALHYMKLGNDYLNKIMNEPEGDSLYNHVMASVNYKAFLWFDISDATRTEYEEKLKDVTPSQNVSMFSGVSKSGLLFIGLAAPTLNGDTYEETVEEIRGDQKELELFEAFTDPPGMSDPIYFAFDLFSEDLLGKTSSLNVELSELSFGKNGRPIEGLEKKDANVETILKQFNRDASSNLIKLSSWNLFLFDLISVKPKFFVKVNDETIVLEN